MSSCGKRRHPDQAAAIAAAIRLSRGRYPLRAYECPGCGGWHLSKRPSWTPEPVRA